jgi:hypothetical protein
MVQERPQCLGPLQGENRTHDTDSF